MKSSAKKIVLEKYDDIFETEESREDKQREKIQEIAVSELYTFENHPFQVKDDESMTETIESVQKYGVLVPGIVRPRTKGGYEIIAGHRRKRASELAGKETMPVIIRELTDDEAIIIMVDSNLQRDSLLPSEKAFAYKMKMDAITHQGATCGQVGHKSRELLAEKTQDSGRQIQRYIRLTQLIPMLLQMVDDKKLAFNSAVELSYLKDSEQDNLLSKIQDLEVVPSLLQSQKLKKYSQEKKLTIDVIEVILSEEKASPKKITIPYNQLKKYFPSDYTQKQIENTIIELLENTFTAK